jgi:uncharacterized OsmC-like protein
MRTILNGLNTEELRNEQAELRKNPEKCKLSRSLTAEWVGGTRARVYSGDRQLFIGGEEDFGAMSVTLASLLACEVDLIATHATLRGIELEKLIVEGAGDFNLARYMSVGSEPRPGFQKIELTLTIKAKNGTSEQLKDLAKLCETASPVMDTVTQQVPVRLNVLVE